mmetsp:Transcript_38940/g.89212  ORF Transcript_38940/g.89212 Transcript_38940/m.89212 type:complete len:239 (-) Transcript_38940:1-717(-)
MSSSSSESSCAPPPVVIFFSMKIIDPSLSLAADSLSDSEETFFFFLAFLAFLLFLSFLAFFFFFLPPDDVESLSESESSFATAFESSFSSTLTSALSRFLSEARSGELSSPFSALAVFVSSLPAVALSSFFLASSRFLGGLLLGERLYNFHGSKRASNRFFMRASKNASSAPTNSRTGFGASPCHSSPSGFLRLEPAVVKVIFESCLPPLLVRDLDRYRLSPMTINGPEEKSSWSEKS